MMKVINSKVEVKVMKGRGGTGSMHNKYAIFDGTFLETGSANWSLSAESWSYENMMFIHSPEIIFGYRKNFEWMWAQANTVFNQSSQTSASYPISVDDTLSINFNGVLLPDYVFSSKGGTENFIIKAIDAARFEIDVAMFAFTSKPIMEAIYRARARGVTVKILIYVKSSFPFREAVSKYGVELRLKPGITGNGLMHNKFCVLDKQLLINGSFNWSSTAENLTAENTIFTTDMRYVSAYESEFEKLYSNAIIPK